MGGVKPPWVGLIRPLAARRECPHERSHANEATVCYHSPVEQAHRGGLKMVDQTHREAPNVIEFVSKDQENFLISLVKDRELFLLHSQLHAFYAAAIKEIEGSDRDLPLVQLLLFLHFQFLFAQASFMRGYHLSVALGSARGAIDAALIGAYIIHDRAAGEAYAKGEPPFDNFARRRAT